MKRSKEEKEAKKLRKKRKKKESVKLTSKQAEEISHILETNNLEDLIKVLGLEETEKMTKLRIKLITLITEKRLYIPTYIKYENLAIDAINQGKNKNTPKGQIALLLMKASLFRDSGHMDYYKEYINDAITYTNHMHFDNIRKTIRKIIVDNE